MGGSELRGLRTRLGLTQFELAEALGVDQATVSRWERGVDRPRPSRVAKIRDLLAREDRNRALARQLALVRLNLRPASVVRDLRLEEMSRKATAHYARTRGIDVSDHVGRSFLRHTEVIGNAGFAELLLDGVIPLREILLARMQINIAGFGSLVELEPLSSERTPDSFLLQQVCTFEATPASRILIERVELVPLDDPSMLVPVLGLDAPPPAMPHLESVPAAS